MSEPLLSVCLITYNHVNYIKQAIDGVLMQKVNFSWELIIADDYSTDGTREIVLEHKKKYPDFIKLILQEKNVGPANNWMDLITYPKSKYIAYFEGDDYWTDQYKLQKQVCFLEANPEFSLCFHNVFVKHEGVKGKDILFCDKYIKEVTSIEDVIANWYIPTASMVFKKILITPLPAWFDYIYNGDYSLHLILANKGKIGYINEEMGVYRIHKASISFKINPNLHLIKQLECLFYFNQYSNFVYNDYIQSRLVILSKTFYQKAIMSLPIIEKIFTPYYWIIKFKNIL